MRNVWRRVVHSLGHLGESVRSQYGGGLRGYCKFAYYSCLRVNRFCVYAVRLADIRKDGGFAMNGYEFAELHPDELDVYRSATPGLPKEFYTDRMHEVSGCHAVLKNGEIVYLHWLYYEGGHSRFLRIGSRVAEIGYIVTLPEHRRRGICSAALAEAFRRLRGLGVEKVCTVVHWDNVASRKAMLHAGMVEEARVMALGPFNMRTRAEV